MKRITLFAFLALPSIACCADTNLMLRKNKPTAPPTTHFTLGQIVEVGDSEITVTSIKTNKGSEFVKPQKGIFLVITVKAENIGKRELALSERNWTLRDNNDQEYNGISLNGVRNKPSGKIVASSLISRSIAYDIPKDKKRFSLSFKDDRFSPPLVVSWNITVTTPHA